MGDSLTHTFDPSDPFSNHANHRARTHIDIKEAESHLREILDRCPAGIAVINFEGIYLAVNPAYANIYGYTQQEMTQLSFTTVFPEEARASVLARHQQFIQAGGKLGGEWTVQRRDGTQLTVWSESVTFPQEDGKIHRLVYVLDITEKKKSEERMQIASSVYETCHEAIMVTNPKNQIISVNPAFVQLTGYSQDEVLGLNPRIFKSHRHDHDFYAAMWHALKERGFWNGELWDRRKNGEEYVKELSISVIKDEQGEPRNYVGIFSDITARKKNEELIWYQANYDALTGIPNRHMFRDRLKQCAMRAEQDHCHMALLFLDLDNFKEVNDTLGHNLGDKLLSAVAKRIRISLYETDTLARLGGDEFALILSELGEERRAETVATQLLEDLAKPFQLEDEQVYVSASIGIAIFPDDAQDLEELLKSADQAMYAAKNAGRNCFNFFTGAMQQTAIDRHRMAQDLRHALLAHEFELYYQPIVDLQTSSISKTEALIRWKHPRRGMISPGEFIPIAESNGLIIAMGEWVLEEALRQLAEWRKLVSPNLQISINLSPVQLRSTDFDEQRWINLLSQYQIEHSAACIEITESMLLNAEPRINQKLFALRNAGFKMAIDDFGTGYSSLSYLRKFDIDYLKIDRSFVQDMDGVGRDICEAIVVMAHRLGLQVIAEGVETAAQSALLKEMHCDYAQGFLFARPVDAASLTSLLLKPS